MGPAEVRCRKVTVGLICKMFVFFLLCELLIECSPLFVQFFPVMVGDMDNSGSLNAQIIHQISSGVRSKLAFQVNIFFPLLDILLLNLDTTITWS